MIGIGGLARSGKDTLAINLAENSSLNGKGLESEKVTVTLQGATSAVVNVTSDIQLTSSGASKTYVYGEGKIEIIDFLDTSELHKEK